MTMWPAADSRLSRAHRPLLVAIASLLLSFGVVGFAAAQDAVVPPAGAPALSLTFSELNDSGVSGIATLYGDGEQTVVQITVEGAGSDHPAHIHKGSCDDLDPYPAFPLKNVVEGSSATVVDATLDELLTGGYSIDIHMSVNELGTLVACTPVTGVATDGTGEVVETPEATEEPDAEATPGGVGGIGDGTGDGTTGAQIVDDRASLPLSGLDDNGVTGIVSLTKLSDEQTDIIIQLSGDAIVGGHIAHLHLGTCDDLADEGTIDLANVDSTGLSETTVDVPFTDLIEGGYAVNVHQSETDYDTWLVCGEFSGATIGAVIPEVAPPTGGGSETPTPTVAPTPIAEDLPATAGVGFGLPGANSPLSASFWAIVIGGSILCFFAFAIRRGERTGRSHPTRWRRLGL